MSRRRGERGAAGKVERKPSREASRDERHGPDWEPSGPEWSPPEAAEPEKPPREGAPASDAPAKAGDPPLEHPFGERSRHGGRLPGGP